ncbi:MAG: hypothetical protein CO042_02165 [Parcubacteria group bacterium CG_4_9_14_0_2_um_filter_41_8]|nr:MAG: hypothetical protein CO042_02165 [Parcubacteria group bacterium CG_4_9_14_0_2_um_filter_41_8]
MYGVSGDPCEIPKAWLWDISKGETANNKIMRKRQALIQAQVQVWLRERLWLLKFCFRILCEVGDGMTTRPCQGTRDLPWKFFPNTARGQHNYSGALCGFIHMLAKQYATLMSPNKGEREFNNTNYDRSNYWRHCSAVYYKNFGRILILDFALCSAQNCAGQKDKIQIILKNTNPWRRAMNTIFGYLFVPGGIFLMLCALTQLRKYTIFAVMQAVGSLWLIGKGLSFLHIGPQFVQWYLGDVGFVPGCAIFLMMHTMGPMSRIASWAQTAKFIGLGWGIAIGMETVQYMLLDIIRMRGLPTNKYGIGADWQDVEIFTLMAIAMLIITFVISRWRRT